MKRLAAVTSRVFSCIVATNVRALAGQRTAFLSVLHDDAGQTSKRKAAGGSRGGANLAVGTRRRPDGVRLYADAESGLPSTAALSQRQEPEAVVAVATAVRALLRVAARASTTTSATYCVADPNACVAPSAVLPLLVALDVFSRIAHASELAQELRDSLLARMHAWLRVVHAMNDAEPSNKRQSR